MTDRIETFSGATYLALVCLIAFLTLGLQGDLLERDSALSLFNIGGELILAFIFLYPAFWAFSIRRALAVRLYRDRALIILLVSLLTLIGVLDGSGTAFGVAVVAIFYWIDNSFRSARRSDPLLRDTIKWSVLRYPFWVVVVVCAIPLIVLDALTNGNPTGLPGDIATGLDVAVFIIVPATAGLLIAVASRRSGDPSLRQHLGWFGIFALSIPTVIFVAGAIGGENGFTYFVGFFIAGYALFKSARSLAPINRLPTGSIGEDGLQPG